MNRTAKKELRNRGLRVKKTPKETLRDPGIFSLLTSAITDDSSSHNIRKAHKGERL